MDKKKVLEFIETIADAFMKDRRRTEDERIKCQIELQAVLNWIEAHTEQDKQTSVPPGNGNSHILQLKEGDFFGLAKLDAPTTIVLLCQHKGMERGKIDALVVNGDWMCSIDPQTGLAYDLNGDALDRRVAFAERLPRNLTRDYHLAIDYMNECLRIRQQSNRPA